MKRRKKKAKRQSPIPVRTVLTVRTFKTRKTIKVRDSNIALLKILGFKWDAGERWISGSVVVDASMTDRWPVDQFGELLCAKIFETGRYIGRKTLLQQIEGMHPFE